MRAASAPTALVCLALLAGCSDDTPGGATGDVDAAGDPAVDAPVEGGLEADGGASDAALDGASDQPAELAPDSGADSANAEAPPGPDVTDPFPLDRGDDGDQTPGTYRGLWLRLVDNGAPAVSAVDGVIGVVCIGMSNSNQECGDYLEKLASQLADEVSDEVIVVNCAVGGHAIERWNDPAFDDRLWDACVDTRLGQAGVRLDQVRVVYHKAADQFTAGLPTYPDANSDYFNFIENLDLFAARVNDAFPALQAVYTTSRSYGGFAGNAGRGEPLSFEEGLALNAWLAENAEVNGVWYGWGPYIWAPDCASGENNGSGVCYERSDYQADGIHPAQGARDKISAMIHARFSREVWYAP